MHRQSFSYGIALRARAKKIVILHSTESFGLRTHSDVREAIGARQMRKHLAITAHQSRSVGLSRVTEGDERSELALYRPALRDYVVVHFS